MKANIEELTGWLTKAPNGYVELHTREPELSWVSGRWSANYGGESLLIEAGSLDGLYVASGDVVQVRILIEKVRTASYTNRRQIED